MAHIPIIIFSFAYLRPSLLPQNYIYTYWKVYFHLTSSAMFFWPSIAMITAVFFLKKKKKDYSYRNKCGIWLHDADLEHSLLKEKIYIHMFFCPFFCSGIPSLASVILKMLIRVYFCDVLQPAV